MGHFPPACGDLQCYKLAPLLWYARRGMEHAPRKSRSGVSAGMLLASAIVLCIAIGAAIGAAAGSVGYGIVFGAVLGIPVGTAVVVVVYRDAR